MRVSVVCEFLRAQSSPLCIVDKRSGPSAEALLCLRDFIYAKYDLLESAEVADACKVCLSHTAESDLLSGAGYAKREAFLYSCRVKLGI